MGDNQDQDRELRYVVKQYRDELEFLTGLNESVRKLVQVSRLVERIIKTHYAPEDFEKPMLGSLLHFQKGFLGGNFSQAAIGIDVRNQMSHDDARGFPNEARLGKGFEALSEIVEIHCLDLEKDLPPPPNPSVAGNSETARHPRFKTDSEWTEAEPRAYVTQIERRPPPQLEATESDPDVSASTIAEYAFCPRAGILTHEGGFSDPEEELPSLGLLPWYEQAAIEEAYLHSLYVLFALPVGLLAAVVILSLLTIGNPVYPFLLAGLVVGWLFFAWRAIKRWREIGKRRLAAHLASACNPVPGKNASQPVDWWGLLLAGYEVRRPEAALHDERWKLSGKPRRILDKGAMSIPVHRIRKTEGPVLPQHIVRVMAHCHLIEATEGANSPFGIVLFGDTYLGMTVPNTDENRDKFHTALERVRTTIAESDARDREPPEPVTGSVCSGCHYGYPRSMEHEDKTTRYGEPLDPILFHNGKKLFHCDCGDRFKWKPKHDRNRKMRLVE